MTFQNDGEFNTRCKQYKHAANPISSRTAVPYSHQQHLPCHLCEYSHGQSFRIALHIWITALRSVSSVVDSLGVGRLAVTGWKLANHVAELPSKGLWSVTEHGSGVRHNDKIQSRSPLDVHFGPSGLAQELA